MSDCPDIPLPLYLELLEEDARIFRSRAAEYREYAAQNEQRALVKDAMIRELKAQIAAGGTKQESLFVERP